MFSLRLSTRSSIVTQCRFKFYANHSRKVVNKTKQSAKPRNFQFLPEEQLVPEDELYLDRDFDYEQRRPTRSKDEIKSFSTRVYDLEKKRSEGIKKNYNSLFDEDDDHDDKHGSIKQSNSTRSFERPAKPVSKRDSNKIITNPSSGEFNCSGDKKNRLQWKMSQPKTSLPYDINVDNQFDVLDKVITPYRDIPYGQQLQIKYQHMRNVLANVGAKLDELGVPYRIKSGGLPCPLESVKPSPMTEHYRNKDEFSVWPGVDGNRKTVGFLVGKSSRHKEVVCVPPDRVIISPQSHIDLAQKFEDYLREVSPYDSCQNYGLAGHWRRILIRSNRCGEHMVTAVMHPQDLSESKLEEEMNRLCHFFRDDERIKSLHFHASRHTRSTKSNEPYYHLDGDKTIAQNLFAKQFNISPSSFFQVNSSAAEVLYRNIITELDVNSSSTVLDLCCGTGILATLLSGHVNKIIAIDSSSSAIQDARINAAQNNAHNIEFIHGPVEEVLPQLVRQGRLGEPMVATTNPTRRGLHRSVINMLKQLECIQRLVYISCKADGDASFNFVQLCNPRTQCETDPPPFMLTNAIPVDLFPYTSHCELIVTLQRI